MKTEQKFIQIFIGNSQNVGHFVSTIQNWYTVPNQNKPYHPKSERWPRCF